MAITRALSTFRVDKFALNPENDQPIDVTISDDNTVYILDQSGQCFAYDISFDSRQDPSSIRLNESKSFNYHQASGDTRLPRKHTIIGNLGFRILFDDGLTRFQALVA